MKNLIKQFQNISHQHCLWEKNSRIVIGVSGGPDSVCLLDIFHKISQKYPLKLTLAHINYGLRGKDSDKDEIFVRELAAKYGLEISVLNPPRQSKNNLEEKLRDIRYDFFEKVRQEKKFDLIAVGHNLDDQAETFLMRILRGSGLKGMTSMKFKNDFLIRPLLSISKKEILEYLEKNNLKYRLDKTNLTDIYLRNKIRNKLIPLLEKEYNPDIKKTLSRSALSISEDYSFLEKNLEKNILVSHPISVKNILSLHPAVQRKTLLSFIEKTRNSKRNISSSHIEEMLKLLRSPKNKSQTITFLGLKISRKGDKVTISKL